MIKKQIQAWKDQLPDDLKYGEFDEDFLIFSAKDYVPGGKHCKHGAWNTDGYWWMAWNTDE